MAMDWLCYCMTNVFNLHEFIPLLHVLLLTLVSDFLLPLETPVNGVIVLRKFCEIPGVSAKQEHWFCVIVL